jgi:alanyl-tRNA synthetase
VGTTDHHLRIAWDKLWATVYETDDEAYDIWVNVIGVPEERWCASATTKARLCVGQFLAMAETGPCGPCSEIFYDHGPEVAGGPPGSPDAEGDRYIEIWNIVFMQFDRQLDAQTGVATLTPLPKPCVDTGMGLERLAACCSMAFQLRYRLVPGFDQWRRARRAPRT